MPGIVELPVEILDQIIAEIPSEQQGTLASLSATCRPLHNHVLPTLYKSYRIKLFGPTSWLSRTEIIRRLVPPGSYEIPPYAIDDDESEAVRDRKGKGVAGRLPSSSSGQAGGVVKTRKPRVAVNYIRSIEICGYWLQPLEEQSDEYYLPVGDDTREHRPFLEALEALLWSVRGLEGFTWAVTRPLPAHISLAVARFDSLNYVSIFGDTHLYIPNSDHHSHERYHYQQPAILTNSPIPFSHNSLVTLKALMTADYQQIIQYGDVMRCGKNWETLRNLELDISSGFVSMLVEMEPLEPDILAALFRPPPPPRGSLTTTKLKLHSLKIKDVTFQQRGISQIAKTLDACELRDLDFYYCQDSQNLFRGWENNMLKNLERLHIQEELALPNIGKFLKQFGSEGACRNLKVLELCCWHSDRFQMYDPMQSMYYDTETDESEDSEIEAGEDWEATSVPEEESQSAKRSLPQPFRSILDLRGERNEGWGLERLILDIRSGGSRRCIPQQVTFSEGWWRLRQLAIPVSYDPIDYWNGFVETIGKLPNLEYLFLLNSRVEHRCGPNFVSFNVYQTPFSTQFGGYSSAGAPARNSRKRKGSSKLREEEPDRLYVDALGIAAQNRLRVHGDGVPGSAAASSSSAAMSQTVWRGKLRYIGIRHTYAPIPPLRPLRVWKVTVEEAKARKLVPEGASERRRSLRSNKRRKMEEGDWRVAEEGGFTCRLVEIENLREKRRLGDGFFYGMEKFTFEDE